MIVALGAAFVPALVLAGCGGKTPSPPERSTCGSSVVVHVAYPGASVEEVDHSIVSALHDVVGAVNGAGHVHSMAREGQAVLTIKASPSSLDQVIALRRRVAAAIDAVTSLPGDSERPRVVVRRAAAVTVVALSGVPADSAVARFVLARIQQHSQVLSATLLGGAPHISVYVDPARLAAHKFTASQVASALSRSNIALPRYDRVVVRGQGPLWPQELGNTVLGVGGDGVPVSLSAVASIRRDAHGVRTFVGGELGSVFLVRTATPEVAAAIRSELASLVTTETPPSARVTVGPPMQAEDCRPGTPPLSTHMARITVHGNDLDRARAMLQNSDARPTLVVAGGGLLERAPSDFMVAPQLMQAVYFADSATAAASRAGAWRRLLSLAAAWRVDVLEQASHTLSVVLDHASRSDVAAATRRLQARLGRDAPRGSVTRYPAPGEQKMVMELRRDTAVRHGVTLGAVARVVRAATQGEVVAQVLQGGEKLSIVLFVRPTLDPPRSIAEVENLRVPVAGGTSLLLRDVVHVSMGARGGTRPIYRYNGRPRAILRITAESASELARLKENLGVTHIPALLKQMPGLKVSTGQ